MPNLSNILDGGKNVGSKQLMKSFLVPIRKAHDHSLKNSLKNLKGGGCAEGWDENEAFTSGADIALTNRASIQKSLTGWKMGPDGTRIYSTYRNGSLVTATGEEAARLSYGDLKCKEGKKGAVKGSSQLKRKGEAQDDSNPAKEDKQPKRQKKEAASAKLKKVVKEKERNVEVLWERPIAANIVAPVRIEPAAYTGPASSETDEVDWSF